MDLLSIISYNLGEDTIYPLTYINNTQIEIINKNFELIINSNLKIKELVVRYKNSYFDDILNHHDFNLKNLENITCHDIFIKMFKYGGNVKSIKIDKTIEDKNMNQLLCGHFTKFFRNFIKISDNKFIPCLMTDPIKFIEYKNNSINTFWTLVDNHIYYYLEGTKNNALFTDINEGKKFIKRLFIDRKCNKSIYNIISSEMGMIFVSLIYILIADLSLIKLSQEEPSEYKKLFDNSHSLLSSKTIRDIKKNNGLRIIV